MLHSPQFKNHRTVQQLRLNARHFTHVLKSFRVLHTVFKDAYRMWYQPAHKWFGICLCVVGLFGFVKLDGRQSRTMGLAATICILYLATTYRKLGLIFDVSVKLRNAWLYTPRSSLWMRKYIRSVRDFRVDVSCFYFVHRTTVVTVLYTILNSWITVLLTYK